MNIKNLADIEILSGTMANAGIVLPDNVKIVIDFERKGFNELLDRTHLFEKGSSSNKINKGQMKVISMHGYEFIVKRK